MVMVVMLTMVVMEMVVMEMVVMGMVVMMATMTITMLMLMLMLTPPSSKESVLQCISAGSDSKEQSRNITTLPFAPVSDDNSLIALVVIMITQL